MANKLSEAAACPEYHQGQEVRYTDHHGRLQLGTVRAIVANWRYGCGLPPRIVYTVSHPTYANRRMYLSADSVLTPGRLALQEAGQSQALAQEGGS